MRQTSVFGGRWRRKRHTRHRPSIIFSRWRRSTFEILEERAMLSVSQDLVAKLQPYQNALNTALDVMTSLPLVGDELSQLQEWNTVFQDSVNSLASHVDTLTNGHFELAIPLPSLSKTFTFDLGLDAFLQINTSGGVSAAINPVLNVGFDLTNGVPSLDTTHTGLDIGFVIGLPNFQLTASLNGLLYAKAVDAGTTFSGNLGFNFDTNFGIQSHFAGDAHVRLGLSLSLVDPALNASFNPRFFTDLELDWGFDTQSSQLKVPVITFRNFSLDADSFMQGFLGDTVKAVQKYTKPMQPFIDMFEQPVPIVSSFDSSETMGDLFLKGAGLSEAQQDSFNTMVKIVKAVNTFDFTGTTGGAVINFGDILLTGDARQTGQFFFDTSQLQGVIDDIMNSPALQEVQEKLETVAEYVGFTADAGFKYPLLENPGPVIGSLLTGQTEVMFSYSTGRQHFELGASYGVGIPNLLGFFLNAGIMFDASLSVGYDTAGLLKFIQDPLKRPADLLHGFYIDNSIDNTGPPIPNVPNPRKSALYLQGHADVSASAVVTLSGGLYADIAFELASNSNSTHVYLDDIITNLSNNVKVFNPSGRLYAAANIELTFSTPVGPDITLFKYALSEQELLSFNLPPAPTQSLPLTVIDVTDQHTLLLDVTKMTAGGKVKVQPFHDFTISSGIGYSGDGIRVDYPNEIVLYVERKNDITTNYYNLIGLSGAVPNGVSIDIVDPFTVFAAEGAPDPQPPQTESAVLLAGGQSVGYRYAENAGGSLATVLLVGGYGSNSLTGGTMTFGNFVPAARIDQAKSHFGNLTGFDAAGQAYINARIDSVLAPASPAGIIGATMTGNRGGLMFGGPGNNSFFAAGAGAYEMIGGGWTNTFTISPSFNGVPATYQIDGGPYGQSKLVVRVPSNENVTFENSTVADKYNSSFKALAVQANAGLSATAHGIKKVQIVAQSGASVTIGDTSELNTEFGISGGAQLTFGGTNLPDLFDVTTTGPFLAGPNHFQPPQLFVDGETGQITPYPSGSDRWPDPVYTITRTFGTNGRTQSIPFAVSDAAASSLKLNAGGASDTYSITLGLGAYLDVAVNDSDASTVNSVSVSLRDSVLVNKSLAINDNSVQLDYYTNAYYYSALIPDSHGNRDYIYFSSVHYRPTVTFNNNIAIAVNTAFAFLDTTINRPSATQAASVSIGGPFTTTPLWWQPLASLGIYDVTTQPITQIYTVGLPRTFNVVANVGTLNVSDINNYPNLSTFNVLGNSGTASFQFSGSYVNLKTVNVVSNTGELTFSSEEIWNGYYQTTYDVAANVGTLNIRSMIVGSATGNGLVNGVSHIVKVRANSGTINVENDVAGSLLRAGINVQVNVGDAGSLANIHGTLNLMKELGVYGLTIDDRNSPSTRPWEIDYPVTAIGDFTLNHAIGGDFTSSYQAYTKPGAPLTLFARPFFSTVKVNGVDYPAWGLYGSTGETNFVNDSINLPVSNFGNAGGPLTYSAVNLPPGLSINPTTGVIAGTIAPQVFSTTTFDTRILATNGMFTVGLKFPWKVRYGIEIDFPYTGISVEGVPISVGPITSTNRFGRPVTLSASNLPPGLTLNPANSMITGTISVGAAQNGPYFVTINANDGVGSESLEFTWTVTGITLDVPAVLANHDGDSVNLQIHSTIAPGLPVVFDAQGLPPGLSINPATGLITGTIAFPPGVTGVFSYSPSISATQGIDFSDQYFYWNVLSVGMTDVVHLTNPGTKISHEGDFAYVDLGQPSENGLAVEFTATGLPPGLSIWNSDFGRYIGGQLAAGSSATSPYNVHISVTNGQTTDEITFQWVVDPIAIPGDYNLGGRVDAADYVIWRKTLGQTGVTPYAGADGNGNGQIGPEDYNVWRSNFGQSLPPSGGAGAALPSIESAPALDSGIALRSSAADSTTSIVVANEPIGSQVSSTLLPAQRSRLDKNLFAFTSAIGSPPGRSAAKMVAINHHSSINLEHVEDALLYLLADASSFRPVDEHLPSASSTSSPGCSDESRNAALDNLFGDFEPRLCLTAGFLN